MRLYALVLTLTLCQFAVAQSSSKLPEDAVPDQSDKSDSKAIGHKKAGRADANQINVIIKKHQIVEEYRHKGELIMVKVIPSEGVPYYIDPQVRNNRTGAHSDLINSGVEPVYWVIKRF